MSRVSQGGEDRRWGRLGVRGAEALLAALAIGVAWALPARAHDPPTPGLNAPATKPAGPAVAVELQAEVRGGLPWSFRPDRRVVRARRGESLRVLYRARSFAQQPTAGKAVHAIDPPGAEAHLDLVECFCFVQAFLDPAEARTFPVAVHIRPTLPPGLRRVVLRYTFAPEGGPAPPPPAGGLEVWVRVAPPLGARPAPPRLHVLSVDIEGEAGAGLGGWFRFPVAEGSVASAGGGGPPALLVRSPAPAGTYRALRIQVAARPRSGKAPGGVAVETASFPVAFTVAEGSTTAVTLDLTVREAGEERYEVHVRAARAGPAVRAPTLQEVPAGDP